MRFGVELYFALVALEQFRQVSIVRADEHSSSYPNQHHLFGYSWSSAQLRFIIPVRHSLGYTGGVSVSAPMIIHERNNSNTITT